MGIMYEADNRGTGTMLTWIGVFVICSLAVVAAIIGVLLVR